MTLSKVYLFVEKENKECDEVEKLLISLEIPYEKIYVDENHIKGYMLKEFGTMKVPLIATPNAIIVGLNDIKKYLLQNHLRLR